MDAFICDATRTPIGRYGGALSSIRTDDLAGDVAGAAHRIGQAELNLRSTRDRAQEAKDELEQIQIMYLFKKVVVLLAVDTYRFIFSAMVCSIGLFIIFKASGSEVKYFLRIHFLHVNYPVEILLPVIIINH